MYLIQTLFVQYKTTSISPPDLPHITKILQAKHKTKYADTRQRESEEKKTTDLNSDHALD